MSASARELSGQPLRPVTAEESAAYARDGAVVLRQVMPMSWIELLREAMEEIFANPGPMSTDTAQAHGGRSLVTQMNMLRNDKIRSYVFDSPAPAIAAAVHGSPRLHFLLDQMFYKQAGEVRMSEWHQDTSYLNASGAHLVRVWTPCDSVPRELAIEFVRGSHTSSPTYQAYIPDSAKAISDEEGAYSYGETEVDLAAPPLPDLYGSRDAFDVVGWAVEPGDVVVFHGHILHGAGGLPYWELPRRALAVMYAEPEETYVVRPGRAVPDIANTQGCPFETGEVFGDHPDIYPVAWG